MAMVADDADDDVKLIVFSGVKGFKSLKSVGSTPNSWGVWPGAYHISPIITINLKQALHYKESI